MIKTISAWEIRSAWKCGSEIALIDVREEGPYAEAHPFFAISLPVSEIEQKLPALAPRVSVPVAVYDNGEGYVQEAVDRIRELGYADVAILDGGLRGYQDIGEVFRDVNVPSKAFGELVEAIQKTPHLPAPQAKGFMDHYDNYIVLDARRFDEYNTMSIPGGQSCPGGELVYRIFEVAPDPATNIIVHCAGRTRSIIGTQSLVNAGIPNKVHALENGTIGWTLAGYDLDTGKSRRVRPPSSSAVDRARQHTTEWATHVGVQYIASSELGRLLEEASKRTIYLFDVRDPSEYAKDHPTGFSSAPGGQLVQATDEWVGVRGARIVLFDTEGVRAPMAASWLVQMGWECYVIRPGTSLSPCLPYPSIAIRAVEEQDCLTVGDLGADEHATVIDLARSPIYRKEHIPGAWYSSGPELTRDIKRVVGRGRIVLTCPDGNIAAINLAVAKRAIGSDQKVLLLQGGTRAWKASGYPMSTECHWLSEPIDTYQRPYEGIQNADEAMQGYIEWEHGLVAQIANDGIAGFHVTRKHA